MCPSGEQKHCNRTPFLSEDGCDRGSVDIHMFDELPYCGGIDPTPPDIPPEIVDTPINIPLPPSCSCVNISYDMDFKYSVGRRFVAKGEFAANGDCCEGRYDSRFDLQIPCPVIGKGKGKISVSIDYGNGKKKKTAPLIVANEDDCTIEANDVDIDLNIPCPVLGPDKSKLKVGISYGKDFKDGSAYLIKSDKNACTIEPLSPNINLNIPCPVEGRSESKKISAGVRYGDDYVTASANFLKADAKDCKIEGMNANLAIVIPCPVKKRDKPKIKVGISYGKSFKSGSASFMKADSSKCEIEPLSPTLNLNIPCPLGGLKIVGKGGITAVSSSGDNCKKVIELGIDTTAIEVPCPVFGVSGSKKIKVMVKVGDKSASDEMSYADINAEDCAITAKSATLNIEVPCPFSLTGGKKLEIGFDTIKYDGMEGEFDTLGGLDALGWTGLEISSCKINISPKKVFKLKALPPTNRDRLVVTTTCTTTTDPSGSFSCSDSYDSSNCQRKLHFNVKFPAASAYGAFRVEDGKIRHCHYYAAHRIYTASSVDAESGSWYLNVNHAGAGVTGSLSQYAGSNDEDHTSIKLFVIRNGKVVDDYRAMPFIPIYA